MKKIRTLVVDDEPLARRRICTLLQKRDDIQLLGECKNGKEALASIQQYKPDLVFMDVQMPDLNGFEVLQNKEFHYKPFIIFVTAFNQYALKAFDVKAVDYLLKPYDDERFEKALSHAKTQIELQSQADLHQKMVQLMDLHRQQSAEELRIIEIKERGRITRVSTEDIQWIEADGNYLRLHLEGKNHFIRKTLQSIENQLDSQFYLRIHRSLLVNTLYVQKVHYEGNNQYQFQMKNGDKLTSGRSFKEAIQVYLEQ